MEFKRNSEVRELIQSLKKPERRADVGLSGFEVLDERKIGDFYVETSKAKNNPNFFGVSVCTKKGVVSDLVQCVEGERELSLYMEYLGVCAKKYALDEEKRNDGSCWSNSHIH